MIPEWKSRKTSVASVSCGVLAIRRRFIAFDGQEHAAGGARLRNHGGFDHLHRRPPLHGAGVLHGLSAFSPLAGMIIRLVLVLRGSVPLRCGPGNRSSSGWRNRPAHRRLRHFRASPCRSGSGTASRRRHPAGCRDHDFRHRRLIFPIQSGRPEAVGDLRPGERPSAPGKMFQAGLRRGSRGRRWRVSRSRESQGHRVANPWPKRRTGSTRTPSTCLQLQMCSSHYLLVRQKHRPNSRGGTLHPSDPVITIAMRAQKNITHQKPHALARLV